METSKKEIVIKKANDHWAFLEHIEAPMWVDLTLEANSGGEDTSDDWFNISHLFHQWSSRQLKSKFSHPGEEIVTSEVDSKGPASPELPSSVSRSRGKHYKSKKWGGNNLNGLFDKQLPARGLSRRCFQAGSSFGQAVKPKLNVNRSKRMSSAKLGLVLERKASGNALANCSKPMANCRKPVISASSTDNKTEESNTKSTVTSKNTQRRQKFMEISSQPCDLKNQLFFRNATLRKSCVMKKASKVDHGGGGRQSICKSSSGKSSVGSCSNAGCEVKSASKQQREKITNGKDVTVVDLAAKNRCKPSNISRTSTSQFEELIFSNRMDSTINSAKPAYRKATKSMVQYETVRSRALSDGRTNKQYSSTGGKEKLENGKLDCLASKRKENGARSMAVHQKSSERGVPAKGLSVDQTTNEQKILQKVDRAGSAALKGKVTREAKNTTNLTRRIYLR